MIVPSAFVALPSAPVQVLSPRARLRIISAGSFHNLLLWLLLFSCSWLGLDRSTWTILGYENIAHYGKVVIAVDEVITGDFPILTIKAEHICGS